MTQIHRKVHGSSSKSQMARLIPHLADHTSYHLRKQERLMPVFMTDAFSMLSQKKTLRQETLIILDIVDSRQDSMIGEHLSWVGAAQVLAFVLLGGIIMIPSNLKVGDTYIEWRSLTLGLWPLFDGGPMRYVYLINRIEQKSI